jgi:hypothetical protein
VLFSRYQTGPDAPVIRVRLARIADRPALAALLHDRAESATGVLRHDPRTQLVLSATTWTGTRERVVGFARTPLTGDGEPEIIVTDERAAPGTATALRTATADRLASLARVA